MKYYQVHSQIPYLNLGCGYRFNPQWTNVDFVSTKTGVIAYDLIQKIPFADDTFELVYHSHVIEHFPRDLAKSFIQECCRVLKPEGILRVAVPDLEQIARLYLTALSKANTSTEWAANYEWMSIELLDQLVRHHPGGSMATYLSQEQIINQEFITQRFGGEAERIWQQKPPSDRQLKQLLRQLKQFGKNLPQLLPSHLKRFYNAMQIGYYRQRGEVHQWMYDRYSLSALLASCGLEQIVQRSEAESYLASWTSFNLDTEADGRIYKPDSLFMEAIKPKTQAK